MDLGLLVTITGLSLADAVNVCAFAVLSMILVAILVKNPNKPKIILKAGLFFTLAVFLMYSIYGIIIFQFFRLLAENVQRASPYVINGLSILIMIIGALNIKDYFTYAPGGLATEMPISIRPYVKLLINKVTSPMGAFFTGLAVTLFLLPCTIMPLVRAMQELSSLGYTITTSIPWLIYYNLIFITPMIAITLLIFFGVSRVEDISGWKERSIRKLHLIAGILLFVVGILLLLGWL